MKTKTLLTICLLGILSPCTHAQVFIESNISIRTTEEEKPLPLRKKTNNNETENGKPEPRTLIPEVTLEGNILNFITPCNGCTLRLVQSGNISYEIEIIGGILSIPTAFTGLYELQIVSGDIIFYTEVEL